MTRLHLAVIVPPGRMEALDALDIALHVRHALAALGAPASIAKDRLRADAVNLVFGAEWGFDDEAAAGHRCVIVGRAADRDGAPAGRETAVLGDELPIGALGRAPGALLPLAQRPIELLLPAPALARHAPLLQALREAGVRPTQPETALHGEDRLLALRRARAVLLLRHDEAVPVDPVTLALCLAEGTAAIAEGPPPAGLDAALADAVVWFDAVAPWPPADTLQARVDAFARADHRARWTAWLDRLAATPARPAGRAARVLIEGDLARRGWRPGWIHLDADARRLPEFALDLRQPFAPAAIGLGAQGADLINAAAVPVGDAPLQPLLANALSLLKPDGSLVLPLIGAAGAPDRAAVERLVAAANATMAAHGRFEARFEVVHVGWLAGDGRPVGAPDDTAARIARVVLRRVATGFAARMNALTLSPSFGLDAAPPVPAAAAATPA